MTKEERENVSAETELRIREHVDRSHDEVVKNISGRLDGMETRLREYIGAVDKRHEQDIRDTRETAQRAHRLAMWLIGGSAGIGLVIGLMLRVPDFIKQL